MNENLKKPRILFVVNVDWFFLSHRLPLALEAKRRGYDVFVAAGDTGRGEDMEKNGLKYIPLDIVRNRISVGEAIKNIWQLIRIFRKVKPDLVHLVTGKPILYGNIARVFYKKIPVVNALTGLGALFSYDEKRHSLLKSIVTTLYRISLSYDKSLTIFQNSYDVDQFISNNLISREKAVLIRGSGVDLDQFSYSEEVISEKPIVLFASRLIWDKGIQEFVEASRILRQEHPEIRFVIVGKPDIENSQAVPESVLQQWNEEGVIEWPGFCSNMRELIAEASLVVLPTYYPEGVPKILIEAAACGRAIIASDIPGCREIVEDGTNGILVEPKNSEELADKIQYLLQNPEVRTSMGKRGRQKVLESFSLKQVIKETFACYEKLLNRETNS